MKKRVKVIVISGKAQHGKDTLANYLREILEDNGKKAFIIHYADYLKMLATHVYQWNGEKDERGREILQKVGDKMRAKNIGYFVEKVLNIIEDFKDEMDYIIIPDGRLPLEINIMKDFYDGLSIRINREYHNPLMTREQQAHITETALDEFSFDYSFTTTDLESVKETAQKIFTILNEKE